MNRTKYLRWLEQQVAGCRARGAAATARVYARELDREREFQAGLLQRSLQALLAAGEAPAGIPDEDLFPAEVA